MAMKSVFAAAIILAGAAWASPAANAQGAGNPLRPCTARVVYSEELPFAPIDSWLVKVTLEITPKNGTPYYTTLHERMPWQGPPPRRGQAFRLWCDPANPNDLHLASRPTASSWF
jgi:glycine/D-amino acid oxidase-like deaminating enzyme